MGYPTKIATCCYCGTRAALVLKGDSRHELSCANCGAPLHDMKQLSVPKQSGKKAKTRGRSDRHPSGPVPSEISGISHQKPPKSFKDDRKSGYKKKRKRKSFFQKAFEEFGDVLEDIFD